MNILTDDQVRAIDALMERFASHSVVLVGAAALAFHVNMHWRRTQDVDLVVSVSVEGLTECVLTIPGWARHPTKEHEWLAPGNVKIDLIPAGPEILARRRFTWPISKREMRLVGMRLAIELAAPHPSAPTGLRITPPEVLVLLKMIAYLDNPAARLRDLADIAHVMEDLLDPTAAERYQPELELAYDEASAFVIGQRLSSKIDSEERTAALAFLAWVRDAPASATLATLLRYGPRHWNDDPQELFKRLDAFERGLGG